MNNNISLELIDDIMNKYWNDDEGEFNYNNIKGSWELIDVIYEYDDIKQYIFNITIESVKSKQINNKYEYTINNLKEGDNTLKAL